MTTDADNKTVEEMLNMIDVCSDKIDECTAFDGIMLDREAIDEINKKFDAALEEEFLPTFAFVGRCARCAVNECNKASVVHTYRKALDGLVMKCVDFVEVGV